MFLVVAKTITLTPLSVCPSKSTKGSSLRVEVQVGGRTKSAEESASVCWEDPEEEAQILWTTRARDSKAGKSWLT